MSCAALQRSRLSPSSPLRQPVRIRRIIHFYISPNRGLERRGSGMSEEPGGEFLR
jgi:hypothetical protein